MKQNKIVYRYGSSTMNPTKILFSLVIQPRDLLHVLDKLYNLGDKHSHT